MKKLILLFNKKHLVLPLAALLFFACQNDIPVQELADARAAIQSAKEVDAEKHSPDELGKAEALVKQSHDEVVKEEADSAKKSAILAVETAKIAEQKSLPLFAQEKLSAADEKYSEADKLFAGKFSPEKFARAGEVNNEAKSAYDAGEFRKAADLAVEAETLAREACDDSLQNSSSLDSELSDAGSRHLGLKNDEMADAADAELKAAAGALTMATDARDSRDFRTAYSELDKAKAALDLAEKAIKKKKLASEIVSLRSKLESIRSGKNPETVAADLDNAMLELNGAETALEQDNISDAEMRINSAKELIAGTENKLKKGSADEAIANAEKMLASAKEKDTAGKYTGNLGTAESLINEGKELSSSENYNDAISKADEAETIIAAVLNSLETDSTTTDVTVSDANSDTTTADQGTQETKGEFYTVQWRKKDTDCLWRISQKVYNDASLWPLIYVANRDQIKNPDLIFPGQKFKIPPKPDKKPGKKELRDMIQKEKSNSGDGASK
ncbi:MAG TPA: LysM peptidoglycan-binding domain-containing protein [Spirochaetota bacterium]|nr:LysM peptidoglycan-binding domain-containing protein [Spirochaetota bacterium]